MSWTREGVSRHESPEFTDESGGPERSHPVPLAILVELDLVVDEPMLGQLCVDEEPVELDWSVVVVVVVDVAAKTTGATALAATTAMTLSISRIRLLRCIFLASRN